MPALMVKRPSVAAASKVGTTGTPGHICALTDSTGPTISRVSGGAGESVGSCVGVILILSFAMTRARVFCTSATGSPGRMRQFTVARARWGRALVAWPASSIVATQVVRKVELLSAVADSRAIASASGGSRRIAFISAAGEMVDRVVLHRHRAVPAGIGHLELVGLENLFAGLDGHAQSVAVLVEQAVPAFVERELGVDQVAVVLEQVYDAAEIRRDDFLVAGRYEDEVALRTVAFPPVADEIGDEHRDHRLVVGGAAGVEIAVFLDELEGGALPVLALRLHHIEVSQQHDRSFRAGAPVAGDEVALLRPAGRHDHLHLLRRQPARFQACGHRLRRGRAAPGRVGGVDLDQRPVDLNTTNSAGSCTAAAEA